MSSSEFQLFSRGMFHELDERLAVFLARQNEPMVTAQYERVVADEWSRLDCRLDGMSSPDLETAIDNHRKATTILLSKDVEALNSGVLRDVHSMMVVGLSKEGGVFRAGEIAPLAESHEPSDPASIESGLRNLFEWTAADSFAELHPVQQTALVLVRLLDICPFTDATQRTSRVLSNWYLIKAGFPPAIIAEEEWPNYHRAVEAAFRMDTTLLTALVSRCVARTLDRGFANSKTTG
jgi:Fic family protein